MTTTILSSNSNSSKGFGSVELITPDPLPPVRFNILGQMQIKKIQDSSKKFVTDTEMGLISRSHSVLSAPTTTTSSTSKFPIPATAATDGHSESTTGQSDSPIDFSFTSKKAKIEKEEDIPRPPETESPCSRLRKYLKMKSPDMNESEDDFGSRGAVLNLSKEANVKISPQLLSAGWKSDYPRSFIESPQNSSKGSTSGSNSSASASCSPVLSTQPAFQSPQQINIPIPPGIPGPAVSGGNNLVFPTSFSPFGRFDQTLSPILSHTIPCSGVLSSMPFDSQQFYSHHIMPGGNSGVTFGNGPPATISTTAGVNNGLEKSRGTRPFKAYPKDPMTFPSVGMYGVPLNATPGTAESILHQQSNRAYADFRKQMLSRAQANRRGGQRNLSLQTLTEVNSLSTESLRFGLEVIEPGAVSSGAEDSHSNSEEGYGLTNRNMTKSDRQAKDEAYWERRRKNNEAAKRSRDARRAKEDEIAIRAVFLEQENMKLRLELCTLRNEIAKRRCMIYSGT